MPKDLSSKSLPKGVDAKREVVQRAKDDVFPHRESFFSRGGKVTVTPKEHTGGLGQAIGESKAQPYSGNQRSVPWYDTEE